MSTQVQPPTAAPKRPPTPAIPPSRPAPPSNGATAIKRDWKVKSGVNVTAQKVVIYGPGGVGKSELCSLIKECGINPLFLDIGDGTNFLDVPRVLPTPTTYDELRDALHSESLWSDYGAVVIDDLTKAEEMATAWVIANVKHEKRKDLVIRSIEDYGWGKGLTHTYEAFLKLLGDLDGHQRRGRHVICVAHECTANVPNPAGEDFIRYEPRLQSPASGKASIRHRVKEWADHLIFVGFDTSVDEEGKGTGSGTRTIYPTELPSWWAKSRSLSDPIIYSKGSAELWKQLLGR